MGRVDALQLILVASLLGKGVLLRSEKVFLVARLPLDQGEPVLLRVVFELLRAPWYHPTLAEILTYPLEELADQIKR